MNGCQARQYSDRMSCPCGLEWDTNDPDPPECRGLGLRPKYRISKGKSGLWIVRLNKPGLRRTVLRRKTCGEAFDALDAYLSRLQARRERVTTRGRNA